MSESPAAMDLGGAALRDRARDVLRRNDLGGWTKPAPALYPHQWSWDSAFIAIGLATYDWRRAGQELTTLFAAQWATGMVPHIVFNPAAPDYFPNPQWWDANRSPAAPNAVRTSGICQPPVHAIALAAVFAAAVRAGERDAALPLLRDLYSKLFAWHRYLLMARDPEGSGLVGIYHPWESLDNSPRWDAALARVRVGAMPPYLRHDLKHVADASERPTMAEYDRYLWLVESLKSADYDDARIYSSHPFLIKDVLVSGILVAANDALAGIAAAVDAPDAECIEIAAWAARGRRGLAMQWDAAFGLCLDYDVRAGEPVRVRTVAGFAPLVAGGQGATRRDALVATWDSAAFVGAPGLRWPLPPSTSPDDPAFRPRAYWRGPVWPVVNWLFWWAFDRDGDTARAARLRTASLAQLADGTFAEYYEPYTGVPLGSHDQSWTAAVALAWLAQ